MESALERKDAFKRNLLIVCAMFSLCALISSFLVQYVWKIEPCRLCKLQRLPYFFLCIVPFFGISEKRCYIVKVVIILLFSISLVLAAYHLMVINGIVKDFCAINAQVKNIDDFMAMLDSHVPCSRADWIFLGIPVAGYNLLISFVFICFFLRSLKQKQ